MAFSTRQIIALIIIAIITLGVCVIAPPTSVYFLGYIPQHDRTPNLLSTNCLITQTDQEVTSCQSSKSSSYLCYIAKLYVQYNISDHQYTGNLFACQTQGSYGSSESSVRQCIATSYRKDSTIQCFYDPNNPNYVQLQPVVTNEYTSYVIFAGVAGGICAICTCIFAAFMMNWHNMKEEFDENRNNQSMDFQISF